MNQEVPDVTNGNDLRFVFEQAKVGLAGGIGEFKAARGIGEIKGFRNVINDGNTIVYHFWDSNFHYILLHEIKY